jgi:hypothetical protein
MAVRTESGSNLDPNLISRLLVLAANLVPENTPSTVSHVLRAASLLGYPVMGRAIACLQGEYRQKSSLPPVPGQVP